MISVFWGGFFDNQSEFLSEKLMSKRHSFPRSLSPGFETTEVSAETLQCQRKLTPPMEKANKEKRESDRNRSKVRVNGRALTQWRALRCWVKVRSRSDMGLSLPLGLGTAQSCHCFYYISKQQNLQQVFIALRLGFLTVVFCFDSSQAACGGHVGKAAFANGGANGNTAAKRREGGDLKGGLFLL